MDFGTILDSKSYGQVCKYAHVYANMQVCKYESMQVCLNCALCKVRGKLIVCSLCDIFCHGNEKRRLFLGFIYLKYSTSGVNCKQNSCCTPHVYTVPCTVYTILLTRAYVKFKLYGNVHIEASTVVDGKQWNSGDSLQYGAALAVNQSMSAQSAWDSEIREITAVRPCFVVTTQPNFNLTRYLV